MKKKGRLSKHLQSTEAPSVTAKTAMQTSPRATNEVQLIRCIMSVPDRETRGNPGRSVFRRVEERNGPTLGDSLAL